MSYIKRRYVGGEKVEKQLRSILSPEMRGLMFVTAIRGFGKSTLATDADFKPNMAMWDFDKNEEVIHSKKVGYYKNMLQVERKPLARAQYFLKDIESLQQDRYTVAIIDNVMPLQAALFALVQNNAGHYAKLYSKPHGAVLKNVSGATWGVTNDLISDAILEPLYNKGIKLVVATSHAKARYKAPGKFDIQGSYKWQDSSIFTLILVNGDNFPIPSAMVWKEALPDIEDKKEPSEYTPEEIESLMRGEASHRDVTRKLPRRMPEATFQKVRWYLNNPADLYNPAPGEELIESEFEPFTEQLSESQMAIHRLSLEQEAKDEKELLALANATQKLVNGKLRAAVQALNGQPPMMVLKQIQAKIEAGELEYDGEITPADIVKWSNEHEKE